MAPVVCCDIDKRMAKHSTAGFYVGFSAAEIVHAGAARA